MSGADAVGEDEGGRAMPRIGLLGGTFNPVHLGHLRAAEEVREALGLERVLFAFKHAGGTGEDLFLGAHPRDLYDGPIGGKVAL